MKITGQKLNQKGLVKSIDKLLGKTILIEDVTTFPGYIACDAEAKSEIVVPLHDEEGKVIAVLDVDSNSLGRFGDKEQELFEALGKVLEKSLWSEKADV